MCHPLKILKYRERKNAKKMELWTCFTNYPPHQASSSIIAGRYELSASTDGDSTTFRKTKNSTAPIIKSATAISTMIAHAGSNSGAEHHPDQNNRIYGKKGREKPYLI